MYVHVHWVAQATICSLVGLSDGMLDRNRVRKGINNMSGILRYICDRRPQRCRSFLTRSIRLFTHTPNTEFVKGITNVAGSVMVWPKVIGWGILRLPFSSKEWTKKGY
jgi:hypothetical protein